jgi:hypothetical protein
LAPKTQDTSGRTYQPELLQCDQVPVSLKTSRDISALGFPTCCKTWQKWVTERRGVWRQRVNAARLTRGRGFSFWPSVVASEVRQGFQDRSRGMKGSQESLTTAVVKDAANWPTPNAQVSQDGESPETWLKRKEAMKAKGYNGNGCGTPLTIAVQLHGQAAPASSSSLGSRQGLWRTPQANEAGAKVETLFTKDGAPAMPGQRAYRLTPSGKLVLQSQTINQQVEMVQNWATPRSGKTTDENPETWALRQAKGDVATMPLTAQVKAWATPKTPTGGPETAKRKQELGRTASGGGDLASQANGKLNPRWVETLMGLPIGWTMPSCTSPQTIAPMSCDSSAMELCQPPQSGPFEFSLAS